MYPPKRDVFVIACKWGHTRNEKVNRGGVDTPPTMDFHGFLLLNIAQGAYKYVQNRSTFEGV